MTKYLFLFSIGPVQTFIAQARKTQDLFAGSRLLSDLVRNAIEQVGEDNIVYPYHKNKSLTNRLVATINAEKDKALIEKLDAIIDKRIKKNQNLTFGCLKNALIISDLC